MNPHKERHMYDGPICTSVISTKDHDVENPCAVITFYKPLFTQIHGPFKFYVKLDGTADPDNCDFVVQPGQVFQRWEPSGKSVDAKFPLAVVGGATRFSFYAVTLIPGFPDPGEVPLVHNVCPNP